jgi:lipopolysaccharide export system permease protein
MSFLGTQARSGKSLQRYLFRQVLVAFLIVEGSIIGVTWVIGSLYHLGWVVNNGVPFLDYVYYNLLLIPLTLRTFITPAATLAVVFAYNRLISDRESVAMNAAGVSTFMLARPALVFAGLLALFLAVHLSYLSPLGYRQVRALKEDVSNAGLVLNLKEKEFTSVADNLTIYVGKRFSSSEFADVLVWENEDEIAPSAMIADQAKLVFDHGKPFFVLYDGTQQSFDRNSRKMSFTEFEQYTFNLEQYMHKDRPAARDFREMYMHELWALAWANPEAAYYWKRVYTRIASVILVVAMVVISAAILLSGPLNRLGQVKRVISAVSVLFMTEAAVAFLLNASVANRLAGTILFSLLIGIIAVGFLVLTGHRLGMQPLLGLYRRFRAAT